MIDFYEFLQFSLLASRAHHITFLPTKIVLENASIENLELLQSKPLTDEDTQSFKKVFNLNLTFSMLTFYALCVKIHPEMLLTDADTLKQQLCSNFSDMFLDKLVGLK